MPKAVVLLSGGIDSTVCAVIAHDAYGGANVHTLSILYGQSHAKEIEAAKEISRDIGAIHHIVALPEHIFQGAGSALFGEVQMPLMSYKEIEEAEGVSPTYVPFRNGTFLSIATAMALTLGAGFVYYGAHAEDARGWAYPDTTPEFNGAMANAIYIGTYHKVRLITPLQWMMKAEVIKKGLGIFAPLHLTWSCYRGGQVPCGTCPTCIERAQAFKSLGIPDPAKRLTSPTETL